MNTTINYTSSMPSCRKANVNNTIIVESIQVYEFGINLLAPKVQTNALYAKEIADAYAAIAEVY